jgi:hypothetical protein
MNSSRARRSADYSGRVRALALVAALCAFAAIGCGGERDEAAPVTSPEVAPPAVESNRPAAPAIEGVGLDGQRISLADHRGRPVFVNVWSSW